jgi:hypothetical protein
LLLDLLSFGHGQISLAYKPDLDVMLYFEIHGLLLGFPSEIAPHLFQFDQARLIQYYHIRSALIQRTCARRHLPGAFHVTQEGPTDEARIQLGLQFFDFGAQVAAIVIVQWDIE